ncbi:MAG: glycosyltransferase [Pseudomonadota bacterium]
MAKIRISIITATYNAEMFLPRLIASLRAQTDRDFEWIVIDGKSKDATAHLLTGADDIVSHYESAADFGIYDALNKGIRTASGDYYLVLGADDVLSPDAITNYRAALSDDAYIPDVVTAPVRVGQRMLTARPGQGWLYGIRGHVSAHSIGTLIRRALHQQHGYYSRKFPIAADHLFISTVARAGVRIKYCDFIAGEFGTEGVSSEDTLGVISEAFRVQLLTGYAKLPQLLLYCLRLLNNYSQL